MPHVTSDRSGPPASFAERPRRGPSGATRLAALALEAIVVAALALGALPVRTAQAEDIYWNGPGLPPFVIFPAPGPVGSWFYPGPLSSGNSLAVVLPDSANGDFAGGFFLTMEGGVESEASRNLVTIIGDGLSFGVATVAGGVNHAGASTKRVAKDVLFRADDNAVVVEGVNVAFGFDGHVAGGHNVIYGHGWASASRNNVRVENSKADYVMGGFNSFSKSLMDPFTADDYGEASHNEVFVKDSVVGSYVTGGYSHPDLASGQAVSNLVSLEGSVEIGTGLYGGQTIADPAGAGWDVFSSNVLSVKFLALGGVKVGNGVDKGTVKSFETFRFELDPARDPDSPAIDATLQIYLYEAAGNRASRIEGLDIMESALPSLGQSYLLMRAQDIFDGGVFDQDKIQASKGLGLVLDYDLELFQDASLPDTLTAVFKGASPHSRMEALPDGRSAALALLSQGLDHLSGQGISAAMGRPFLNPCPAVFASAGASAVKFGLDRDNKLRSVQALLGVDCASYLESGVLTLGGFLELGRGRFEALTTQPGGGGILGEGNVSYAGLGALARFDFDNPGRGKNYVEASFRGGELRLDYESLDFAGSSGPASFESRGQYLSGHVAAGRVFELGSGSRLDLFGKYLATTFSGDGALIDPLTPVSFDRSWSRRIQAGGRLSGQLLPGLMFVAGAVYELELDGESRAATSGYPITPAETRGSTGIGELGLSWRICGAVPITLGLGVQGYVGARRGVAGNFQLSLEF